MPKSKQKTKHCLPQPDASSSSSSSAAAVTNVPSTSATAARPATSATTTTAAAAAAHPSATSVATTTAAAAAAAHPSATSAATASSSSSGSIVSHVQRENPSKRWCFTLNNPTLEELAGVRARLNPDTCQFAKVAREVGHSGTPHLQGFVNLRTKKRLSGVKELVSARAHCEVARGTDVENDAYCNKGGEVLHTVGAPLRQGQCSDLTAAVQLLRDSDGDLHELAVQMPEVFVRHSRGLCQWVDFARVSRQRDFKTRVHVYVGPPGCGKSRRVYAAAAVAGTYFYKPRGEWWDGYNGQRTVVVDDFYGWLKHDDMLRICDRYPLRVPVKGAFASFVSEDIYVTSNRHVSEWYRFEEYDASALMRRVDHYHFWHADTASFQELRDFPSVSTLRYGY